MRQLVMSLVILTTFTLVSASGLEIVVDPAGGGDHLDLASAAAVVAMGDTISLVDGIHAFDIVGLEPTGLTLRSLSGNPDACTLTGGILYIGVGEYAPPGTWVIGLNLTPFRLEVYEDEVHFSDCRLGAAGFVKLQTGVATYNNTVFTSPTVWLDLSHTFVGCVFDQESRVEVLPSGVFGQSNQTTFENCTVRGMSEIHLAVGIIELSMTGCQFDDGYLWATGSSGSIEIMDSRFHNATAGPILTLGGGSSPLGDLSITVADCVIADNAASDGPAGLLVAGHAEVFCDAVEFLDNTGAPGTSDALVEIEAILHLNCCTFDPGEIGGDGELVITEEECDVATAPRSWSGIKRLFDSGR